MEKLPKISLYTGNCVSVFEYPFYLCYSQFLRKIDCFSQKCIVRRVYLRGWLTLISRDQMSLLLQLVKVNSAKLIKQQVQDYFKMDNTFNDDSMDSTLELDGNITVLNQEMENIMLEGSQQSITGGFENLETEMIVEANMLESCSTSMAESAIVQRPDSGTVDESSIEANCGPNGLSYKKCVSLVRNAEYLKRKLDKQTDLPELKKSLLKKAEETLKDKELVSYVNVMREKFRAVEAKNEQISKMKKEKKAARAEKIATSGHKKGIHDQHRDRRNPSLFQDKQSISSVAGSSSLVGRKPMLSKRDRSDDNITEKPSKSIKRSSSFDKSDNEIVAAVINENGNGYKISVELWKKVEQTMLIKMIHMAKQKEAIRPLFDGANWIDGHKLVKCGNNEALRFISEVIESWPEDTEVKLKVIPESELSTIIPPKAWFWAPCPIIPADDLVALISFQNDKKIKAEKWKILKAGPIKPYGQHFLLQLDKESLPALERSNYVLRLGIVRGYLKMIINPTNTDVLPADGPGANQPASQ